MAFEMHWILEWIFDLRGKINMMNKTTNEVLLQVENLQVSFFTPKGEVKAVNDIHYTLHYNEIMGIVGESGSGKTVEAFTLMGLLAPNGKIKEGRALFEGRDLLKFSEKEYINFRGKEAGIIFQNPMTSLNPVYTIGKQLKEVLFLHNKKIQKSEAEARVLDMLRQVGINQPEKRMKQYPHELSGGMRQRIMIAMGIINHPKLLIADEPTTALDVTIQAQILDLIRNIQKKTGMAVIFITHNLGVVAEICDKVTVMYAGHIVEQGKVRDVFYYTRHPYTRGLLESMPSLLTDTKEPLAMIQGSPVNLLELPEGCPFAERCKHCMEKCKRQKPPQTQFEEGHIAYCWLNHR